MAIARLRMKESVSQTKSVHGVIRMGPTYQEHQRFALWVYALTIGIVCIGLGALLFAPHAGGSVPPVVVTIAAGLFVFLFDVLALRTTVDRDGIYVRLGWPIPIFWKRFRIEDIRETRVITYRPILDASGWGLRFGRFENKFTIYWNARGNRGVLIDTDKRRYVIGSQNPDDLHAAIERFVQQQNR